VRSAIASAPNGVHGGLCDLHGGVACLRACANAAVLIAARAVQGLGAAILVPNSLALLNHAYPDEKARGRAVGIWAPARALPDRRAVGRRQLDRTYRLALDLSWSICRSAS